MRILKLMLVVLMVFSSVLMLSACETVVEKEVNLGDIPAPPAKPRVVKKEVLKAAEVQEPEPEIIKEPPKKIESKPAGNGKIPYFAPVVSAEKMGTSTQLNWVSGSNNQNFNNYGGKVYLIDVWAEWCAPCKMSTATLIGLHNKYKDDGLVIIGINIDRKSGIPTAMDYAQEISIPYVILSDPEGVNVGGKFVDRGIPNFTLLDSTGKIIKEHTGAITRGSPALSEIEGLIRSQLGL